MSRYRKWSAQEKAVVALEAIKGEKTIAEISAKHGVHSNQVSKWKKRVITRITEIFYGRQQREKVNLFWKSQLYGYINLFH